VESWFPVRIGPIPGDDNNKERNRMKNLQRDPGFYWIRLAEDGDWTIGQWTSGKDAAWYPIACEMPLDDSDLAEIDPEPIRRAGDDARAVPFPRLVVGGV
jgi:hypothetical protein